MLMEMVTKKWKNKLKKWQCGVAGTLNGRNKREPNMARCFCQFKWKRHDSRGNRKWAINQDWKQLTDGNVRFSVAPFFPTKYLPFKNNNNKMWMNYFIFIYQLISITNAMHRLQFALMHVVLVQASVSTNRAYVNFPWARNSCAYYFCMNLSNRLLERDIQKGKKKLKINIYFVVHKACNHLRME